MVIFRIVKNPLVFGALICATAVYSGSISVRNKRHFSSTVSPSDIIFMKGKIVSNPVKSSRTQKYLLQFEPKFVRTSNGIVSTCSGILSVMIDSSMVEAYFPGKLYSEGCKKGTLICENGAIAELSGRTGDDDIFFADSGCSKGFPCTTAGKITHVRALFRVQFRRLMYAWGAAGGFLLALLSGIKEYTEQQTVDAFRNAGLSHILALSGMHLSIFSDLAVYAGYGICGKKAAQVFQVCAILLFVWFAGFSPSLRRAFFCSIGLMILSLCGIKKINMLSVLSAAFLCHIAVVPSDCMNASLMLSYGAMGGIFLFKELINGKLSYIFPSCISSSLSTAVAAQTFTTPVSLKLFGTFFPGGIIASVVVSPFITIFIYIGLLFIILCLFFPVCAIPAGIVLNSVYSVIKIIVVVFSYIPGISIQI